MSDPQISELPIYKTMVSDGHSIFPMSTIEYQGKRWLVPVWLVNDKEGWQTPKFLVCLAHLQMQDLRQMTGAPADFSVGAPIPKTVLEGQQAAGWLIVDRPPIRFRKQQTVH